MPFRHTILRSVSADETEQQPFRLALVEPRDHPEQRCIMGFQSSLLNRCESWLPTSHNRARTPLLESCGDLSCGQTLAQVARSLLHEDAYVVFGRTYPQDCTGYVMAALYSAGAPIDRQLPASKAGESTVALLYRMVEARGLVHRHKVPDIGDLVFFDDTHDRNHNGRLDDPLTHVGIVERVGPDGTITFLHRVKRGSLRYRMNLFHPSERRDPKTGEVQNHFLRLGDGKRRLTGELFHSFASIAS